MDSNLPRAFVPLVVGENAITAKSMERKKQGVKDPPLLKEVLRLTPVVAAMNGANRLKHQ
jgi:hypothetical protein